MKTSTKNSNSVTAKPRISTIGINANAKIGMSQKRFREKYNLAMDILRAAEEAELRSINAIVDRIMKNA